MSLRDPIQHSGANERLEELISILQLSHLDHESGLFVVESISEILIEAPDGKSPASNCIYYALTKDHPQNHLHWLMPDDYQILIEGGPADYYVFHPEGKVENFTMGRDLANGHKMIVATPGNCRKAIRLHSEADYLLVGSVVTPAWNPDRITFGAGQDFIRRYAGKAGWATPDFLKELIGPNFKEKSN
ncbi:MAG: cupin domain-containing protein [Verrucomicrobia bacterium]|nr:cupin domain-containing protein [Verrucomicrobiota bacterium]